MTTYETYPGSVTCGTCGSTYYGRVTVECAVCGANAVVHTDSVASHAWKRPRTGGRCAECGVTATAHVAVEAEAGR